MINNVTQIAQKLESINKKLYIVGGFCRDKILKIKNKDTDIDITTDALPDEVKAHLTVVGEVGKKYGTCIVKEGADTFELTSFRKDIGSINNRKPVEVQFTDSLEEDAKRRDFTCNSVYFDPITKEFIDPENGIKDIKDGIIRFVGNIDERIDEDALRILRFVRFKNRYNFKVADEKYWEILKNKISLLKNISIERIRQEFEKILLLTNNTNALQDLKTIGFFKEIIPEIDSLDTCEGNKYHLEGDVWTHTKMCVDEMNKVIKREKIKDVNHKLTLLWTILIHDIGKVPTYTIDEEGNAHYYNHEHIGAELFKNELSKRLLFPSKMSNEIYFIVTEHLRLFLLPDMKRLKARKLMFHKHFHNLLLVGEADNLGRIPQKLERFKEIIALYSNFKIIMKNKIFLTGEDIMKKYPELVGHEIGEKLDDLNDIVLIKDH